MYSNMCSLNCYTIRYQQKIEIFEEGKPYKINYIKNVMYHHRKIVVTSQQNELTKILTRKEMMKLFYNIFSCKCTINVTLCGLFR